jgi:CRP-like cAMP-binding protein
MLLRLSVKNRSPVELLALAADRRELAVGKSATVRAQLINEAKLLEFHADLRAWMQQTEPDAKRPAPWSDGRLPEWLLAAELASVLSPLRSRMALSIADQQALLTNAVPRRVDKGRCLLEQGEPEHALFFLCDGAARAFRTMGDGVQQTVAHFVPGDVINPDSLFRPVASRNSVCMLEPSAVLEIPISHLASLAGERPAILRAMFIETARHASIHKEWIFSLGRLSAESRLAHLLCEVWYRRFQCAPEEGEAFDFPMTQQQLADTLGLSSVHVNRVLQSLRRQDLIALRKGELVIKNWTALCDIAQFDPGYLQYPAPVGL